MLLDVAYSRYVTLVTATICFTLISFVVANISKNEGQASIYSNIFAMPMLFLSSAFYSLDTAPTWIKTLSRLNPFSHFVSGLHSTIVFDLRGAAANLFILLAFGVLALIAAILTFRWDSDCVETYLHDRPSFRRYILLVGGFLNYIRI